jgi:hypothetical protein
MTDVPYAEIRQLAWYLEHDERNHFEAKRAAGEDVSDHIYLAVCVVLEWLGDDEDGGGGEKIGDFADFWRMFPDCFTPNDEKKN